MELPRSGETKVILNPGAQLGPYRLIRSLGQGSAATVFEAEHTVMRRRAALKVYSRLGFAGNHMFDRFIREAEAVARLDTHPNIVRIYEVGEAHGVQYIAMELLEGQTWGDWLESTKSSGPPHWKEVVHRGAKLADALHFAHEKGIIHRDVKPTNILLDPLGEPRLSDFGLARDIESSQDLTAPDQIMGTPAYMAPEQAEGRTADADARADVFSLGVVIYEAACGRHPFCAKTIADTLMAIRTAEAPAMDVGPPDLSAVLMRSLEKLPSNRYPTAAAFADDLRRLVAGEPTVARPPTFLRRLYRSFRQHVRVAALMVALIAAAAIWVWQQAAGAREKEAQEAYERARNARKEGRGNDAIAAYTEVIRLRPDWAVAYLERGGINQELKRFRDATSDFQRAAELDLKDTTPLYMMAHLAEHDKRTSDALSLFSKVLERDPNHANALFKRGQLYVNLKQETQAMEDFRRAAQANPKWFEPWHEIGHMLERHGQPQEALSAYREAIKRAPKEAKLRFHEAEITRSFGQLEESLACYKAAIDLGYADAYLGRADALIGLKRYDEAVEALKEGIKKVPKLKAAAQRKMAEIQKARTQAVDENH